jgi:putative SOS response-associated peptidase YedK
MCQDVERAQAVLRPNAAEEMVAYPVGTQVNSPAHDSPDLIVPVVG